MNGYKLTHQQSNSLKGEWYAPDSYFNPVEDINGDYFIFSEEVNQCVNPDFMWVKNLPEAEYLPPPLPPFPPKI